MIEYWLNMEPAMKTFVAIGTISSLVLTIQMVLGMLGGAMEGVEADFDIGDGGEGGAGVVVEAGYPGCCCGSGGSR